MSPESMESSISKSAAVLACGAMAVFYVAVLYAPTGLLRMSTPASRDQFFLRRFACAAVSTAVSVASTFYLLRLGELEGVSARLRAFGLRSDHLWQAVLIPLSLTSLMYMGSFVCKLEEISNSENGWGSCVKEIPGRIARGARDVMSWRNYFVAPLTEEVVFRACMVPLLLCAGYSTSIIIFLCPLFFSLGTSHILSEIGFWYHRTAFPVWYWYGWFAGPFFI